MSVAWTEAALADLQALRQWIARDSEPLADRILAKIMDSLDQAIAFPRIGRVVAERGDESVRELLFRTFRIIYKAVPEGIAVLSVLHGGRTGERREPRRWEIY